MRAGVLIAWRPGCPHRARALEHLQARYNHEHPDLTVTLGEPPAGPWVKATSIAAAIEQTDAEVVVVADADVWTDALATSITAVRAGAPWAIPHRGVHRLTADSSDQFIAGAPLDVLDLDERAYLGVEGGGIVVLPRKTYEACPMDPRFHGWGGEDESWGLALRALHGPAVRGRGQLVHLWHPPQPRMTRRSGSPESRSLRKRYARAARDPAAMTVLIEEARAHVPGDAHEPPLRAAAPDPIR